MYQSSHILNQLFKDNQITKEFEFSILDECHHLCKWNDNKSKHQNTDILHIPSQKQLGLTATMKKLKNENSIDNYDKSRFGEILESKSVLWAIENKKITDYYLLTLNMKREDLEDIMEKCNIEEGKEELFLSAYMSLLAMSKYNDFTHTLIYTNTTKNAELVNDYIKIILEKNIIEINKDDIYHNSLHSNSKEDSNIGEDASATDEQKPTIKMKKNNVLDTELQKFKNSKYGIISCVYIFGEGFDLPKLNGVVFAENMESEIRIVQSALRGNRIDKNNPDKKSYIMIPFIDDSEIYIDSSEKKNKSFEKVRKIIERLRMEDENIDQKIRAPKTTDKKYKRKSGGSDGDRTIKLEDNDILNRRIKLLCRYSKNLKGNIVKYTKELLNKISSRDKSKSCIENYQEIDETILKSNGLPFWEDMKKHLEDKGKNWLYLYDIDYSNSPDFIEFKKKFGKLYDKDRYIYLSQNTPDFNYPLYPDLEEVYRQFGYNMDFWSNPIGCSEEF